jgi:hypothetical protein
MTEILTARHVADLRLIANLMREGAFHSAPAQHEYVSYANRERGQMYKACALGAIYIGRQRHYHQTVAVNGYANHQEILLRLFPVLSLIVPDSHIPLKRIDRVGANVLFYTIMHLNDSDGWHRSRIADWLDELGDGLERDAAYERAVQQPLDLAVPVPWIPVEAVEERELVEVA